MEQPDFNWPTVQEESHFNESPFQQEFSWNNNQHMHDQLFNGSEDFIPEEELHHEQNEAQEVEEMQLQVDQVQQTKEEVEATLLRHGMPVAQPLPTPEHCRPTSCQKPGVRVLAAGLDSGAAPGALNGERHVPATLIRPSSGRV